jgi:hypothetical protein
VTESSDEPARHELEPARHDQPKFRISWVPKLQNPSAPTAAELAAAAAEPLGGVADADLQFTADELVNPPVLKNTGSITGWAFTLSNDPDWIVLRPAPDLPPGHMPAAFDGMWLDRAGYIPDRGAILLPDMGLVYGSFTPTGRFEVVDGVVAEVFEVGP